MKIETIQLWKEREDVKLTIFVTPVDSMFEGEGGRPAVIVCPGGAYMNCDRHGHEGDAVAMTYAADGYQTFVLEYSVSAHVDEAYTHFPAQQLDLAQAFLMIREHAKEWGVDKEKITLLGFSAGAHLCGMYAVNWHKRLFADYFGKDKECFRPMAAVLIYGLTDYRIQEACRSKGNCMVLPADCNQVVFGQKEPKEEALMAQSPALLVTENMPPTFLAAAADDGLVPAEHSLALAAALQKQGVGYELHMYEYGEHGFALGRSMHEPFREDKKRACASWVPLSKVFLTHHAAPDSVEIEKSPFAGVAWSGER